MSEAASDAALFAFSNSYARMPERFFAMLPPLEPSPVTGG